MTRASDILERIFLGDLSERAQGMMLVLPQGYRLLEAVEGRIKAAYGSEMHPDVRRLSPEGKGGMITVDRVRDTQTFLASSAAGSGMKTLVVYDAHRLNTSAANALLKPLEEPTSRTRILLLTDRPGDLPATIQSRCLTTVVAPDDDIALGEIRSALSHLDKAPAAKSIAEALKLADGDPALAASLLTHGLAKWIRSVREWLGAGGSTPPLPTLSGKSGAPLAVCAALLQSTLARAARPDEDPIDGWDRERAAEACWHVMENMTDIERAGLDAKTRLHGLLLRAASH